MVVWRSESTIGSRVRVFFGEYCQERRGDRRRGSRVGQVRCGSFFGAGGREGRGDGISLLEIMQVDVVVVVLGKGEQIIIVFDLAYYLFRFS